MRKHKWIAGMMTVTLACSMTIAQPLLTLAATAAPVAVLANAQPRLAGLDRYETAEKVSQQGWTTTSDYAILSAGMDDNLVDALTAAPLAKALNAPILLTEGNSLNSFAQSELKRLKVKTVYVTSGSGVITSAVTDQVTKLGITVKFLGGIDRFATSVNIAQALGSLTPISQMVVATAYSNADALSIAGIAAAQGMPILLTDVNALPTATASYINTLKGITHTYVVGGTGVVSDAVKTKLPNALRAGGVDRFDTNRLILKQFAPALNYGQVYVSNGADAHLVDALAVAPLAAQTLSPVVLSDLEAPAQTIAFVKSNLLPKTITALGGESVVPSAGLSAFSSSLTYATAGVTEGSSDPTKKAVLTDTVKVTGDNVTVQNAIAPYSLYMTGNNVTLTNLQVLGTIFLDPGANGVATLNNVQAANIVVLSGAASSIHLNSVTSDNLIVNSTNDDVRVVSSGTTVVGNTYVASGATINAAAGDLGVLVIRPLIPGGTIVLQGTFTQPVVVEGSAVITAAPGASIPLLTIAPGSASAQVTLNGSFTSVSVNTVANVVLGSGAVVTNMTTNAPANIVIPPTAAVTNLTDVGNTGTLVSGGGQVNGQPTTTTPSAPSAGTNPPAGGGGGGGGVPSTSAPSVLSITSGNTSTQIATISGPTIAITPITSAFKQPNIKLDQTASLNISVTRLGTTTPYDLGTWTLTNSASGNDLFSVANAPNLNMLETLDILKATGVSSSAIFSAIDFHGILTQAQKMTPDNKTLVYSSMAGIFDLAKNSGTNLANAFYQALNLPGISAAADSTTQTELKGIINTALSKSSITGMTATTLLDSSTSAANVATLTSSGNMSTFFSNIDFQSLFNALSGSTNKEAIFSAIDFTSLYNAISALPNKMGVYVYAAGLYQAALTVDTGSSIDYGALLGLVITSDNTVTMTLSNANGTRTYTVVKGS